MPDGATKNTAGDSTDEENPENLVATFQTLSAEGDLLAQKGSFVESIDVFTRALNIRPTDKHCLVARSKCYIQVGSPELALQDANTSLADDPSFFKGIFQKAEALYAQGDFELALMFYHRGNRLRPELDEFRIGIQKSREAIENSIGHFKEYRIQVPPRLRKKLAAVLGQGGWGISAMGGDGAGVVTGGGDMGTGAVGVGGGGKAGGVGSIGGPGATTTTTTTTSSQKEPNMSPLMEYKLLGELYEDKLYLQNLICDRDFVEYPDDEVISLVNEGLRYLSTRVEFWRQQNPLYARPKQKKIKPRMDKGTSHHKEVDGSNMLSSLPSAPAWNYGSKTTVLASKSVSVISNGFQTASGADEVGGMNAMARKASMKPVLAAIPTQMPSQHGGGSKSAKKGRFDENGFLNRPLVA
ncbi:Tetratricopeptide repeat protein 25 [Blyttiomyces sp. JEL0837]|nr:Tetratricopeptide repeat protein 25 [Blyttiomyces sp. JEL0837]